MPTPLQDSYLSFPVVGELRIVIDRLLSETSSSAPQPLWLATMGRIATGLLVDPRSAAPFMEAWRALYTVTLCLDHIQDGDALGDPWLEKLPPALQYHLAFSVYVAAQHALAQLDPHAIPTSRITRLQQFWATSVAQLASGQYEDLTMKLGELHAGGASPLDAYERLAALKTGTTFALAFGGIAILATDDQAQIAALTAAGTVYGMLLQYQDDLFDSGDEERQIEAVTLRRALLMAHPALAADGAQAVESFWQLIYASYAQSLRSVLNLLPAEVQRAYSELLDYSFGTSAMPTETT